MRTPPQQQLSGKLKLLGEASRIREQVAVKPSVGGRPPDNGRAKYGHHTRKTCKICQLPRSIMLRVEEDFANWLSGPEIKRDLMSKGYLDIPSHSIYRHCAALNLDFKRVKSAERGISRIVEHGMALLETGQIQLRGSDLIAAITLLCRLDGRLSDNENVTNVLIRNNMTQLEDIAKIKDPAILQEKASQLFKQLAQAGAVPGVTAEQANFNEMRELVSRQVSKKNRPVDTDDGAVGFSGDMGPTSEPVAASNGGD